MATQNNNQDLQAQLDTLREDFSEITKTMKTLSTDYAKQGQQKVRESAQQARAQASHNLDYAKQEVEARPYTSMAVAFGVGLVLGKLLDR
jgi:ElaB/YqjD/DUF883 family membrane-anchored ribosome-binding protein